MWEQGVSRTNLGKLSLNFMDLLQILLIANLIMKQFLSLLLLLLTVSAQTPIALPPCLQYLSDLQSLYNSSRTEFMQQMAPFAVWSGKMLDDMGFPISCLKNPSNAFWGVEVGVASDEWPSLTMYYGLCFTAVCNAENLNQNAGFLINALIQNTTETDYQITTVQFTAVQIEPEITVGSIVVSVFLSLFALSRMADSLIRWGKLCASNSEEEAIAVQSQEMQQDKQAGRMPQHSLSFLQRYSLERAFAFAFQKEQSKKIYAFSLFKILAMPFIVFGYLFFLSNYGASNYFSFQEEIYDQFYAKVAGFAYYLPDAFFFISAFILARKLILKDQNQGSSVLSIFGAVGKRLLKLYPLYLVIILVYIFVTPSFHSGPLWNVYLQQVDECSAGWWRALILIDNWWNPGCFSFAWYVQAEMQLALIVALLFLLYAYRRHVAMITLYILLIATFIGLFFGANLTTSVQTATSHNTILYFQSFYSYLFFYLLGVYFAFIFDKLSVRAFIRDRVIAVQPLITGMTVVAFALLLLVVLRPKVWEKSLKMELALNRIGVMLSLIIFFLPSMAQEEAYASRVHRLSRLTYGIVLAIGLVTAGGFWGLNYFAYVDAISLLQSSLAYLLVAVAVGGPLAVIFDLTPFILPDTA